MTDQERSSPLSQLAINSELRNRPIKQMIEEKDRIIAEKDAEIERLQIDYMHWNELKQSLGVKSAVEFFDVIYARDQRIAAMALLLDEAMAVFKAYVNVPEANALRERWAGLRSGLGHTQD